GGPLVITNSTTATIQYTGAPSSKRVDKYSTTVCAQLNGTVVFSQTLPAAFSDPTVQAAVAQADSILQTNKATFGPPVPGTATTVLQSSIATNPSNPTCDDLIAGAGVPAGVVVNSSVITFGPDTINVGTCKDEIFNIIEGQEDININSDTTYYVQGSVVTTNTFLTT